MVKVQLGMYPPTTHPVSPIPNIQLADSGSITFVPGVQVRGTAAGLQ